MGSVLRHRSGWKCKMEREDGFQVQDFRNDIILPPTLRRVSTHKSKRKKQVPWIGDVWILFSPISPNHFNKFFIPRVEDLFRIRNQILRVENSRTRSRLISWRSFDDDNFGIQWQMDSIYEQTFTLLPFDVVILNPVPEGRQSSFLSWSKTNNLVLKSYTNLLE
jgi:hypothetical protein